MKSFQLESIVKTELSLSGGGEVPEAAGLESIVKTELSLSLPCADS